MFIELRTKRKLALRMLLVNGIESENDSLWPKIISLAKKSRRKQVVVAYLGKGAYKILPLQRGDVLVVDLSEQENTVV
jgi:hypothetical protein